MDMGSDPHRPAWVPEYIWTRPDLARTRRLLACLAALQRGESLKPEQYLDPPSPRQPIPSLLAPHGRPTIHRPPGLHKQTFGRLIREHDRVCGQLDALPRRRMRPRV